jgi:hypothetical protein
VHREEAIVLAPHEQHGCGDPPVELAEPTHEVDVEAAQELRGGGAMHRRAVQRLQEELVELAVEQRSVDERITEDEPAAVQAWGPRRATRVRVHSPAPSGWRGRS